MSKVLALVVALSFSAAANADWSGVWSGGVVYSNETGETQSDSVDVKLAVAGDTLSLEESFFGWNFNFTVTSGEVFLDGQKVGEMNDQKIHVAFPADGCTQSYDISIVSEGQAEWVDDFQCTEQSAFETVKGTLTKQPAGVTPPATTVKRLK